MKNVLLAFGLLAAVSVSAMPKLSGNLRNYADEKAAFLKEIAAETNVDKRATLQLAYAKFEYDSAKDDEPQKWRDAQVKAYETPGLTPATKLEMLKNGVWSKDYATEGKKVAGNDERLLKAYYNQMFFVTRMGAFGVEEKDSMEYRLVLADEARKVLTVQNRAWANGVYIETLGRLERYDEQENLLRENLAEAVKTDNPRALSAAYGALGGFYRARAQRYYDEPEPTLLRKAFGCYEQEIRETLRYDCKVHFWQNVIGTAFALKDYDAVERHLKTCCERMAARDKNFKNDATVATWTGDLAYCRGDYEGAVKAYSSVPSLATRWEWKDCGRCSWDRYAESLYVTGRYEACLKVIPKLCNWCSLADRNKLYARILEEKIAARNKEAK